MTMFRGKASQIHFVGIGGIGMSGIAELLLNLGYRVSGSDLRASEVTGRLHALGARTHLGHEAGHIEGADVVVVSSAVPATNPEVVAAREAAIPVIPRAEMLAELMRLKYGVAIAGSHGKTTTTSLVAHLLQAGGLDPTVVVGGKINTLGTNARLGQGDYLVAEADESDGSFLFYAPALAVVTNIDPEHMEHYGTLEALHEAFLTFINRLPFYGLAVLCLDHPVIQALLPQVEKRFTTYGFSSQADWHARAVRPEGLTTHFEVVHRGEHYGEFSLPMVGQHNVLNALASLAIADEMGVPATVSREALASFGGVQRRFTVRGEVGGVTVVDDYGHHPAEIAAVLDGARKAMDRRLIAVFQPHRYTRTRDCWEEFTRAFNDADTVLLTPIYEAGEAPLEGIDAELLTRAISRHGHHDARFAPSFDAVCERLAPELAEGDLVICFGAGDVWKLSEALLETLRAVGAGAGTEEEA
ncbi:MAG: UDP-N-acetylmuramate--L-alanine ligase [Deltaproteobacteria bacterium]|nr:UDP-N-acetylmuramate--L-alanine ligase [Deltaproteobacteria bacterium]